MVSIKTLKPYHRNPKIGDVGSIAQSLQENGQYRPILVNMGTKTGRKNEVLAGNHTLLASRELGWTHIWATFVNVDDRRARAIVLADNETSRKGSYDAKVLDQVLREAQESGDLDATGFTEEEANAVNAEVERMMRDAEKETELMMESLERERTAEERRRERDERVARIKAEREERESREAAKRKEAEVTGVEPEEEVDEDYENELDEREAHQDMSAVSDQLEGVEALKAPDQVRHPLVGYWGIPELMPELIPTWDDVPKNLHTWAGSATRDMDQTDITWLYNWGVDSTSGMRDKSRMIPAFYAFDQYFDKWWTYPDRYCTQLLNLGVTTMVGPDWTMGLSDDSRAEALHALYKQRWVSRYAQEAGLFVIPNIAWLDGDEDFLREHILGTLPDDCPVIAMQLQTLDRENVAGGVTTYLEHIQLIFDTIKPEGVILYVGKQVKQMIDDGSLDIPCEKQVLLARQNYLSQRAKKKVETPME